MGQEPDPSFFQGIDPVLNAYREMLVLPMRLGAAWLDMTTGWARPTEVRATVKPGPIKVPAPIEKHDERNIFA
jgi:hypothetical protein